MPQHHRPANAGLRILGADVAKSHVVFHDSLTGRSWTTANAPADLGQALYAYADYDWLVCETTGGYERQLLEAAMQLGLTSCRADAAQVKAFIASHGGRAKTDRIDQDMADLVQAVPDLARDEQTLRAIPGVGPVAARSLIALLPELGRLGPKQAASLAGLAPHPRESGKLKARRRMNGDRNGLRPVLFMAALAAARAHPSLSPVYQRLISAGKPKRLAIAAIARKLVVIANAKLRDHHQQLT